MPGKAWRECWSKRRKIGPNSWPKPGNRDIAPGLWEKAWGKSVFMLRLSCRETWPTDVRSGCMKDV